ncbi:hypothetical protein [Paraburkholderia sp. Cpub6]|uniref:hypothetical protein n=1 Tax=Paraburkholderia sp. Cpub6 TaxID=2723094 RepID=UPI00161E9F52|nr:hypothetical protein [Paraburkholderia sp. Cpub6]MBB5463110.1 hypothetical protein [Paraburkholderia sp. Cpub6]
MTVRAGCAERTAKKRGAGGAPPNGPHVDHLFDGGWITFDETGKLITSPFLPEEALRLCNLPENVETGPFNEAQIEYLRYHHVHVFKRPVTE